MGSLSTFALIGIFSGGAIATWLAGIYLFLTTDALDFRWKLGDALSGMILLSVSGSLVYTIGDIYEIEIKSFEK